MTKGSNNNNQKITAPDNEKESKDSETISPEDVIWTDLKHTGQVGVVFIPKPEPFNLGKLKEETKCVRVDSVASIECEFLEINNFFCYTN